jgi:hypothetical protein
VVRFYRSHLAVQKGLAGAVLHPRGSKEVVFEGHLKLVICDDPITLNAVVQVLLHDGRRDVHDWRLPFPVLQTQVGLAAEKLAHRLMVADLERGNVLMIVAERLL